jgi:hypothetical protein
MKNENSKMMNEALGKFWEPGTHSAVITVHSSLGRGGRVVYCGGLENRFGVTADGGSNPSLSAISMVSARF